MTKNNFYRPVQKPNQVQEAMRSWDFEVQSHLPAPKINALKAIDQVNGPVYPEVKILAQKAGEIVAASEIAMADQREAAERDKIQKL